MKTKPIELGALTRFDTFQKVEQIITLWQLFRILSGVAGFLNFLGLCVFIYKITQTSTYALTYSAITQAGVGRWFFGLLILGAVYLILDAVAKHALKPKVKLAVDAWIVKLKSEVIDIKEKLDSKADKKVREELLSEEITLEKKLSFLLMIQPKTA